MDAARARLLRDVLAGTTWVDQTTALAATMRRTTRLPSGLLVVGTPEDEPWHVTAHLSDEARLAGAVELEPTLVRWDAPPGAPAHLAVTVERLRAARRGETLLVVAEQDSPAELLERVHDVRRRGATVLAVDAGDAELESIAHEAVSVGADGPGDSPAEAFQTVQHLLSVAVGDSHAHGRGVRARLGRLLDVLSGPAGEPR